MAKFIRYYRGYKICRLTDGSFIVINIRGEYENHAHINSLDSCFKLIKLIKEEAVPDSDYLLISAIRLVTNKKYLRKLKEAHYGRSTSTNRD